MRIQQWPSVLPIGQPFHSPQMRYSKMSWPICMSVCICLYRWCMSLKLSQELYLIIGEFRNLIIFFFRILIFFLIAFFFHFIHDILHVSMPFSQIIFVLKKSFVFLIKKLWNLWEKKVGRGFQIGWIYGIYLK